MSVNAGPGTTTDDDPDEDALVELYLRARTVASRIVGTQAAPDIASETLIRALSKWRTVNDHAMAWVTVTSANLAVDSHRRRTPVTQPAHTPDLSARVADRLDLVMALGRLPKRQRQTVVLRYLVGLSDAEVAETLGVGTETIKTHLARGIATLRKTLTIQELDHAT